MSYTKPDLRERIKSRVMASGDGGKPGQWSARKAQLVAQKYEEAGGGYSGAKTEGQKSLSKWTKEKWTTSDGKPAERKGGTTRYLPEKAWDKLSPRERSATNAKKREGSREGAQFVANTEAAAEARKEAMYKFADEGGAWQRSEGKNPEGGLNAKGRASLKAQGHDIKPGVKGPADTPEKLKRKGSFLSRMFGPGAPGAMKQENGEPSRRALSAKAWGEPVPSDDAGRARLYTKGQALLKRYENKKKEAALDFPKRVATDLYMGFRNPSEDTVFRRKLGSHQFSADHAVKTVLAHYGLLKIAGPFESAVQFKNRWIADPLQQAVRAYTTDAAHALTSPIAHIKNMPKLDSILETITSNVKGRKERLNALAGLAGTATGLAGVGYGSYRAGKALKDKFFSKDPHAQMAAHGYEH